MIGFVRNVNHEKGFGFIRTDTSGDYFFHRSGFNGHWDDLCVDFSVGKKIEVEFDPEQGPKGPRANNVNRTDWPNAVHRGVE